MTTSNSFKRCGSSNLQNRIHLWKHLTNKSTFYNLPYPRFFRCSCDSEWSKRLLTVDPIGIIFISCCFSLAMIIAADCISFTRIQLSILLKTIHRIEMFKQDSKLFLPEMCNRHINLAIGIQLRLYELILGNPNRLKLLLLFVRSNRLPIDYLAVLHGR